MNPAATLTQRETQVAELIAWGATKKEVADRLVISVRTVENHARSIFEKVGCGTAGRLSAWWFCTRFGISFDLSPFHRKTIAAAILILILPGMFSPRSDVARRFRPRHVASAPHRAPSRNHDANTYIFT